MIAAALLAALCGSIAFAGYLVDRALKSERDRLDAGSQLPPRRPNVCAFGSGGVVAEGAPPTQDAHGACNRRESGPHEACPPPPTGRPSAVPGGERAVGLLISRGVW